MARMDMRFPAIIFFVAGIVFLLFNRRVTAVFRWLNNMVWNEQARSRFPHMAPVGDPPRSVALLLGVLWIACGVVFWFISQR